jgi:hypothetical protein
MQRWKRKWAAMRPAKCLLKIRTLQKEVRQRVSHRVRTAVTVLETTVAVAVKVKGSGMTQPQPRHPARSAKLMVSVRRRRRRRRMDRARQKMKTPTTIPCLMPVSWMRFPRVNCP